MGESGMSTAQKILQHCTDLKPTGEDGVYRGSSPIREGSDSNAFKLTIDDDEHGAWFDHVTKETGSLYDLAAKLGIETPSGNGSKPPTTKRAYRDLDAYAQAHGVTGDVFTTAGWTQTEYLDRPALSYPTANGTRWRFIDGEQPVYISPKGYKACWYGLDRAVTMAQQKNTALVICNGEASTVVAQHYGVPACATTGGEGKLNEALLTALQTAWQGDVWIALDCDRTGQDAAQKIAGQIKRARVLDLGLHKAGDLADFCGLHQHDTLPELQRMVPQTEPVIIDSFEMAELALADLDAAPLYQSKPMIFPFPSFHRYGGFAEMLPPGKMVVLLAPSGGGKTSWLETLTDALLERGESGMWYGPEWTAREYHWRRIQRLSSLPFNRIQKYELYKWYIANDEPVPDMVKPLDDGERVRYRIATDIVTSWSGRVAYVKPMMYLEDVLDHMSEYLFTARNQGRMINWVVFDYIQMLNLRNDANSDTGNAYERALGRVKDFVQQHSLIGIVASQVNKTVTSNLADNVLIKPNDANYIREDKSNLLLGLNTLYQNTGDKDMNGDDILRKTDRVIVSILKNNTGTQGDVRMKSDFTQLRFIDESWAPGDL